MVYSVFCNFLPKTIVKFHSFSSRTFHQTIPAMVKVGEPLPPSELTEGSPTRKINLQELSLKKKFVIFGVPGAFTPSCSKTHVPGFIQHYDLIKSKGVDEIFCISVNDPFVMEAWSRSQQAEGKIRMLSDADASYTKSLNLQVNIPALGGIRSKRYSMVVEDGIIKQLNVEPDGTGLTCSLAEKLPI